MSFEPGYKLIELPEEDSSCTTIVKKIKDLEMSDSPVLLINIQFLTKRQYDILKGSPLTEPERCDETQLEIDDLRRILRDR